MTTFESKLLQDAIEPLGLALLSDSEAYVAWQVPEGNREDMVLAASFDGTELTAIFTAAIEEGLPPAPSPHLVDYLNYRIPAGKWDMEVDTHGHGFLRYVRTAQLPPLRTPRETLRSVLRGHLEFARCGLAYFCKCGHRGQQDPPDFGPERLPSDERVSQETLNELAHRLA